MYEIKLFCSIKSNKKIYLILYFITIICISNSAALCINIIYHKCNSKKVKLVKIVQQFSKTYKRSLITQ